MKPTQMALSMPIIERIFKKMKHGLLFPNILVVEEMICDGHHRYIASLLAGFSIEQSPGMKTSSMVGHAWKDVVFTTDDWDTVAKVKVLNEQDAHFNNITIDEINEILS